MGLSSNILWHQTTFPKIRQIIKSKQFLCSYCIEDCFWGKMAFPMISMCDLPISEFTEFQGRYGGFSIGLKQEWGIMNDFNPIWYYEQKSKVPDLIRKVIEQLLEKRDVVLPDLMEILFYMKKKEGPLPKHNYKLYRFYDEREVRYVPDYSEVIQNGEKPVMSETEYQEYKQKHHDGPCINIGVSFDWSDIRYIIVAKDSQISSMIDLLEKQGCDNKNIGVFSSKQIYQDFIGYKHNEVIIKQHSNSIDEKVLKKIIGLTINELRKHIRSSVD